MKITHLLLKIAPCSWTCTNWRMWFLQKGEFDILTKTKTFVVKSLITLVSLVQTCHFICDILSFFLWFWLFTSTTKKWVNTHYILYIYFFSIYNKHIRNVLTLTDLSAQITSNNLTPFSCLYCRRSFTCRKCVIRAVKIQRGMISLRLWTPGSVSVPLGLQCCIMFQCKNEKI